MPRIAAEMWRPGTGEAVKLGGIAEQHFDAAFGPNTRGTLFTVQKALPLFKDGGSIFVTGSNASVKGFPGFQRVCGEQGGVALLCSHLGSGI